MLRTLFLVLLLANGLLLAAYSGLLDTDSDAEREPQRLQRQHQPGLVKVLDAQAASAALAAASAAVAASAAQAATACVEAGPFAPAEAATAERSVRELGLAPEAWQALRRDEGGAWLVYMGRYADRELLQRKLAELRRLKLDGEEVQNAPDLQPGISLGRFDDMEEARAALAQLNQRGVRTARVITLRPPQTLTVLRLPAADGALRARLAALQLPNGSAFAACVSTAPGPAPAAPASSAASAAAPQRMPAAAPTATPVTAPVAKATATPAASAAPPAARASAAPAAAPASQARTAGADTRAALARAASAAAAEASRAAATPGSAPASR